MVLKPSVEIPEDAAGYLRFLGAEICKELLAMSASDAKPEAINAALDRLHDLSEEMWRLTIDVRAPHQ